MSRLRVCVATYQCELRDAHGRSVWVEVDAREWPVTPDLIAYRGKLYVASADHFYREARVFWYRPPVEEVRERC